MYLQVILHNVVLSVGTLNEVIVIKISLIAVVVIIRHIVTLMVP